jgi:hypothetical protein
MLYFSNRPGHPDSVDTAQYQELKEFKASCQSRGLYASYNWLTEFRNQSIGTCNSRSTKIPSSLLPMPLAPTARFANRKRPSPLYRKKRLCYSKKQLQMPPAS